MLLAYPFRVLKIAEYSDCVAWQLLQLECIQWVFWQILSVVSGVFRAFYSYHVSPLQQNTSKWGEIYQTHDRFLIALFKLGSVSSDRSFCSYNQCNSGQLLQWKFHIEFRLKIMRALFDEILTFEGNPRRIT